MLKYIIKFDEFTLNDIFFFFVGQGPWSDIFKKQFMPYMRVQFSVSTCIEMC